MYVPSVADTFLWNGKQVAYLAKCGTCIYILAESTLLVDLESSRDVYKFIHCVNIIILLAQDMHTQKCASTDLEHLLYYVSA